jgi:hypothetical protein
MGSRGVGVTVAVSGGVAVGCVVVAVGVTVRVAGVRESAGGVVVTVNVDRSEASASCEGLRLEACMGATTCCRVVSA